MYTYIEVVACSNGETIHRIDATGLSEKRIEKICGGIEINLNLEEYYVSVEDSEEPLELIDKR